LRAKVSGSQTDLLAYDGRGRDHPFPVSAGAPWRERDVARRVGLEEEGWREYKVRENQIIALIGMEWHGLGFRV